MAAPPASIGREAFPLSTLAGAMGRLALSGASLGLTLGLFPLSASYPLLVEANTIADPVRRQLVAEVLLAAAFPVALAILSLATRRRAAVPSIVRAADLASPLGLASALPMLMDPGYWHEHPLPFLCSLAGVTLLGERLVRRALDAVPLPLMRSLPWHGFALSPRARRWLPLAVVLALGAAYSAQASYVSRITHERLATNAYDLGIYDNLLYNAMHGHPFRSPVVFGRDGGNFLAAHAEFAMLLFVPLYALHPGPEALLVLQSVLLGMAAIPLYLFAETQIPRPAAVVVASAYLLYAPLHGPTFYEFHWLSCAVFFHFTLYYAIATYRPWLTAGTLALLFLIREDVAIGTAMLGVFLVATGARPRWGVWIAASSALWFVVDKFGIMAHAGSWWFASLYAGLVPPGARGYGSIIETLLTNPVFVVSTLLQENKLVYALHMFAPLAFLPGRRAALLLLAVPGFFFTLMTTGYEPTVSIAFQYTTHWIPYLFGASVLALGQLGRLPGGNRRRHAALFALASGVLLHSYVFGSILQHRTFVSGFSKIAFSMSAAEKEANRDLRSIAARIPLSASVAATERECPHVSTRPTAYALRLGHGDADYLLVRKGQLEVQGTDKQFIDALSRNEYGLVARSGEFFLFGRDFASPAATEAALAELGVDPPRGTVHP
jgi:uncharacterized membrane protein